jgi:hypothetical protein
MRSLPPSHDELEISIIGPGRGESIIIHLGQNEWAVVDSCIAKGQSVPAAIEYLRSLTNAGDHQIRFVLATHWHDDHIRGLSSILSSAPSAEFAMSAALKDTQFLTLVGLAGDPLSASTSVVRELAAILRHLAVRRANQQAANLVTPKYAVEHRELLALNDQARPFAVRLRALSPSDTTFGATLLEIASLIPRPGDVPLSVPAHSPNDTSVTLWLEAGNVRVLLGADLEHTNQNGRGWSAVLAAHNDPVAASVFKIPHHGSSNGHHPEVWSNMLGANPISIVTPYSGGKWLPLKGDLRRIAQLTQNAYCTAKPASTPKREPLVEKKIKDTVTRRRAMVGQAGHVRIRWRVGQVGSEPTVEVFNGAYRITVADTAA